jgi:hypothetical protein
MLDYPSDMTRQSEPQLQAAMKRQIGGSVKAQEKFLERIESVRSPAVIEITSSFGKRCRFFFLLSLWEADEHGGATVWWHLAEGRGAGRVERRRNTVWRVSRHALIRLVQRTEAHDALKLLAAMRELATAVVGAMANNNLKAGDGKTLKVQFPSGYAILEWPQDSAVAVVKTTLQGTAG